MIPVDREIDTDGTSHQRAADAVEADRALIEQTEHDEFSVLLPEYSEGSHRVQYRRSRFGGHRVASCDCAHHEHRGQHTGQPCAHILAIALSDERGTTTTRDRPIRPYQRHDEADDLTDDREADEPAWHPADYDDLSAAPRAAPAGRTQEAIDHFDPFVDEADADREAVADGGRRQIGRAHV